MKSKKMYLEGGVIGVNPEYVKDLEEVLESIIFLLNKRKIEAAKWEAISLFKRYQEPSEDPKQTKLFK